MKPNFALSLSFEGIGLLHRAFPGWNRVGEVALDSPDLAGALEILRETGEQIAGDSFTTKLVIPNDQIKFLTLDLGIMGEDERHAAIRTALEGATPYPVDDLEFDWSLEGDQTMVAAVARETLTEAEDFARAHGFAPVSFVAIPPDGQFSGEPFFGETRHARTLLEDGEKVLRDMAAIRITGIARLPDSSDEAEPQTATADPLADTQTAKSETTPEAEPEPTPAPLPEPVATSDAEPDHAPEAEAAPEAEPATPAPEPVPVFGHAAPEPTSEPEPEPEDDFPSGLILSDTLPADDEPVEAPTVDSADEAEAAETPVAAFASMRVSRDDEVAQTAAPALSGVRRDAEAPTAPTIPLSGAGEAADHAAPEITTTPATLGPNDDFDDTPPMPAYLGARAAADRDLPAFDPDRDGASQPPGLTTLGRKGGEMAASLAASIAERRAVAAQARDARAATEADTARETERRRMTVFGARQPEPPGRAVGGKPRYLGLILSLVLLMFLAGVAAWASIFMEDGLSRLFGGPRDTQVALLPAETVDELSIEGDEAMVPNADGVDPDQPETLDTAALDPQVQPDDPAPPALVQPTQPHALTEKEAQARYAVTGVWQRAPQAPQLPDQLSLDDLYLTSIDPRVDAQDAVALPALPGLATDLALQSAPQSAQRGARFQFDDRGLVVASTAGTPSPEGFLVFAGRPPLWPAALPRRFSDPGSEPDIVGDATRARLAGIRPKPRPGDLVEQNERENLGGLTRNELAGKRPKVRPDLPPQKTEEESQELGTELAVAESRKPQPRPSNFTTRVERAQQSDPETEPEDEPTQVAAVVPRSQATAPAAPSKASVAQAATVRNQLNLSKVNLIGVYGKPSSRRALVRLANGRYKKVQVGDRLDGGQVQAIGDTELRYVKNGRSVILKMPRG